MSPKKNFLSLCVNSKIEKSFVITRTAFLYMCYFPSRGKKRQAHNARVSGTRFYAV